MIDAGTPGTALPTERELAARFDTSRTTVRQALAELTVEGRLERTQGRGTFISEPKLITIRQLTSFSDDLAERGIRVRSEILEVTRAPADPQVAEALGVSPGEPVARVERLRFADDAPIAQETAWLPGALPRLRAELERHGSLYRTLDEVYGVRDRRRRGLGGDRAGQPAAGPAAGLRDRAADAAGLPHGLGPQRPAGRVHPIGVPRGSVPVRRPPSC